MKLHRDLGIGQSAAWFMLRRLRKVYSGCAELFSGTMEVDETCIGGLERMKRNKKKTKLPDVPENDIPDKVHVKAGMFTKAFMKLPPMTQNELKIKNKGTKIIHEKR